VLPGELAASGELELTEGSAAATIQEPESSVADPRSQLRRNSGAMAVSRFLAAVASLLAVPVIIHDLGFTRFGVWESMVALVSLTTILTAPAAGTLLWRMSMAWGERDRRTLIRLLWAGIAGAFTLTVVLVPIAVLLRHFVSRFLGMGSADAATVQTLFLGLVVLVLITTVNDTLGALNSAAQRVRITSFGQTVGQITAQVVCVTGLRAGLGLHAMLLGVAVGQLTTMAFLALGVRTVVRRLPATGAPQSDRPVRTSRYFALFTVGTVSGALRGQTDRVVLAWLASPVWVGYYSLAARLASLLMEFSNLLYVPTIAAVGALMGTGRWGAVRSLFATSMKVVSGGAAVLGVVLIGMPGPLLLLWVGRPVPEAALILRILSAGILLAVVLTGPGTALCKGIGRLGIETQYVIIGLILNITLTIVLSITVGAMGTVIASSISWSVGAIYFAFLLHRKLRLPRRPMRQAAATLVGVFVAAAVTASVLHVIPSPVGRLDAFVTLLILAPLGIATLVTFGTITGGVGFSDIALLVNLALRRAQPWAQGRVERERRCEVSTTSGDPEFSVARARTTRSDGGIL
jgi:O-antigen/teichoic acid export membrane protein